MIKNHILLFLLCNVGIAVFAQCDFVANTYNNSSTGSTVSVGQAFTHSYTDNGYACEGLQQPFLYRGEEIALVSAKDLPFTFREGREPAAIPNPLEFGATDVYLRPIYGLDSLLNVFVTNCTVDLLQDYDGNSYATMLFYRTCWMKENLKSVHYQQDLSEITHPMVYHSDMHPDVSENLNIYGRLYTWHDAVKLPENGNMTTPETDANGNVQGICPTGWHLPSETEMRTLANHSSSSLRTTNLWIIPGTNTTDFSLRPAGLYNPNTRRFENLGGETMLWCISSGSSILNSYSGHALCWCSEFLVEESARNFGYSIRCIQD